MPRRLAGLIDTRFTLNHVVPSSTALHADVLPRLASLRVKSKSVHYIHLHLLMQDLKAAIKGFAKGDVLDLGCGNKPYREWHGPRTRKQTGCDIVQSDQRLVNALCEAHRLPFAEDAFDTVLCTQVLEHVYHQRELVADAYRLRRPSGHLILTVPFCWEIHEAPYDFFRVTRYGLTKLLTDAGFHIVEIKAKCGKLATAEQMMFKGDLVLVGQGNDEKKLRQLAIDDGLEEWVKFFPFHANHYALLRKAKLLVSTSRSEGFGNVLVEALILGVPALSADCPHGPKDILLPVCSAALIPPDRLELLPERIDRFITQPYAIEPHHLQRFTRDFVLDQYLSLIGHL